MMETTVNTTTQGKMVRNTVMRMKKNQKKRRMRIKKGLRRRRMKTLKMKKKVTVISRIVSRLLIHVVI